MDLKVGRESAGDSGRAVWEQNKILSYNLALDTRDALNA